MTSLWKVGIRTQNEQNIQFEYACLKCRNVNLKSYVNKDGSLGQWFTFFAFWGAEKHVIHIAPFRTMRNVLKIFRYLEVSNRVRNWNKLKNIIFVGLKLQLCQLEIPIFIYKIMSQRTIINSVSFLFCEFV